MSSSHSELIALINGDFNSLDLRLIAEVLPKTAFNRAAKQFVTHNGFSKIPSKAITNKVSIDLSPCKNTISSVKLMQAWLGRHIKEDLYLALLHGSLGTGEVVPYSDFDALVILRNELLKDYKRLARVSHRLYQARRFMYRHDQLQHHGWFALLENDLSAWPETYLPVEVLRHATVLSKQQAVQLRLTPVVNRQESKTVLRRLLRGVLQEITSGWCFKNLYQFKSMISKVLLIPSLYVQAINGKGVFKRDSFYLAKVDFRAAQWQPVEIAIGIRQQWPVLKKKCNYIYCRPGFIGNLWRKNASPPVPLNFRKQFNEDTVEALKSLIMLMEKAIS